MVTNQPGDWKERTQSSGEAFGGRIGTRLRDVGRTIVKEQKTRACEELETISEVAHETADRLHERDDHLVADAVDALAEEVEHAAEFIREHSLQEMIERANIIASRSPEVFLGGAFILGLAAGRFFRASTPPVNRGSFSPQRDAFGDPSGADGRQQTREGIRGPDAEYETHVSEAGPINVASRHATEPVERTSSGHGESPLETDDESRQPEAGSDQQRLNPHVDDQPQRAHGGGEFDHSERESQERSP